MEHSKPFVYKKAFVVCTKCRKRLIERLPSGLWKFVFGKRQDSNEDAPVEILFYGSLKMKCLRRSCKHWNILNYFPTQFKSVMPVVLSGEI